MDEHALREIVWQIVGGDLHAFEALLLAKPSGVDELRKSGVRFIVSAPAVKKVLLVLQRREVAPELIQQWASFIRRGYFGRSLLPRTPLHIDYNETQEDAIVEAIGRLDELGDFIDGEIRDAEITKLIQSLDAGSGEGKNSVNSK
jgi:hypothetical protein